MLLASLLFLLLLLLGVGNAEQCPSYPNPRTVSPEQLFKSPEVVEALAAIDALFTNASASLPGFMATVVFDQQTMFAKGYGYKNITNKTQGPPTRTSLVRIASITKTFTTTLMYVLQERSLISLEDNVKQYLPTFSMQLAKNITLRELASHTAGIPREMPYPCASFTVQGTSRPGRASSSLSCNETAILDILQTKPVMSPTHRRFHYSNLGMALLGRALAHVPGNALTAVAGGSTYEDLVRHYITAPQRNVSIQCNHKKQIRGWCLVGRYSSRHAFFQIMWVWCTCWVSLGIGTRHGIVLEIFIPN